MAQRKARIDVHAEITAQLIEQKEQATGLWDCPWYQEGAAERPRNAVTGKGYNGINIVALWAASVNKGYTSGYWATFRQWQSIKAAVRKGEKGSRSVFYKTLTKEDEQGEEVTIPFARSAVVFSAEQVDGFELPEAPVANNVEALQSVERLITATGANIRHDGGERAYYRPKSDSIHLPQRQLFDDTVSYYGTVLHELVHWTGAPQRLDRDKKASYAFEELVAELGAAFLCCELNITATPRADHAEYLAGWLQALRDDNNAIARASSMASKAVDYVMSFAAADKQQAA